MPSPIVDAERLADRVIVESSEVTRSLLRGPEPGFRWMVAITTYEALMDRAVATVAAVSRRERVTTTLLLRSTLEALVNVRAIVRHTTFHEQLLANYYEQKRHVLKGKERVTQCSPLYDGFLSSPETNLVLSDVEKRLKGLRERGIGRVTTKRRFELADFLDAYYVLYWTLSLDVHLDLGVLVRENLSSDASLIGTSCGPLEEPDALRHLLITMSFVLTASAELSAFVGVSGDGDEFSVLEGLRHELEALVAQTTAGS